jgi:hypothetical protein
MKPQAFTSFEPLHVRRLTILAAVRSAELCQLQTSGALPRITADIGTSTGITKTKPSDLRDVSPNPESRPGRAATSTACRQP